VRPGEKLHEVLITEDDSRTTLDLGDRYIIEPAIHFFEHRSHAGEGYRPVPASFCYRSDTNSEWLDVKATRKLLGEQGYLPRQPG
jgi:UDP-N-acetylglucosamine 4,6-dehydratase